MFWKTLILFLFCNFIINNTILANQIYETKSFNVNIITSDATKTKKEQIKKIKIQSFNNILDKIIFIQDKKKLLKNFDYDNDLEKIIQNILINNELITKSNYIADIKINFDKNELITLLKDNKINYSDIISNHFLIVSSYTEPFLNIGLNEDNFFYDSREFENIDLNKNLMKFKLPNLDTNDRYILPYEKIIKNDITSFEKISYKYSISNTIIINLEKDNNKKMKINFYLFSLKDKIFYKLNELKINNNSQLHQEVFNFLNNWWKSNNLINNNVKNYLECKIKSHNYLNLIEIRSKIRNLSQVNSVNIQSIQLNNNIINISYFGEFKILVKSLLLQKISINNENECIISSIK